MWWSLRVNQRRQQSIAETFSLRPLLIGSTVFQLSSKHIDLVTLQKALGGYHPGYLDLISATSCPQSMSYRLETPRPRRIPSPLNFDGSFKAPSILSTAQDNDLLYDLPAATSISPPISPRSPRRVTSPTSPSYSGRSRGARNGRPTPPPNARNRSQTPQGVAQSELEQFAECCRAW